MHIHILGIGGSFMGGIARLASTLGHRVTGSDSHVYPPMSDLLARQGISLMEGYDAQHLEPPPDLVLIGNALSRGNHMVEHILNTALPYMSAPEWLRHTILHEKQVLAVSGTHGKTTTTALMCWILEQAGLNPGFLIGGEAKNFEQSARYTDSPYFVIEADEYDTAFFDKRSKFIHYLPKILVINNIEFDHADIFTSITEIEREFARMIRLVPGQGRIIARHNDPHIRTVLNTGCWTAVEYFGEGAHADWQIGHHTPDYSQFTLHAKHHGPALVKWELIGKHNALNAVAAIAAAHTIGVPLEAACSYLTGFLGVKRRLEHIATIHNIHLYDDFAHHPSAIHATLEALRKKVGEGRIFVVMEPRSNSMKMGTHQNTLADALVEGNRILLYQSKAVHWDVASHTQQLGKRCQVLTAIHQIVRLLVKELDTGDSVVFMSNGGFDNIQHVLIDALQQQGQAGPLNEL